MSLEEIKLFLRVAGSEEDTLLIGLQSAAEEYMTNAGVKKDYTKGLYKLAIRLLISHWYENRVVVGKSDKIPFGIDNIIIQLKYSQVEVM